MTWAAMCLLVTLAQPAPADLDRELAATGSFEQPAQQGNRPDGWAWPGANAEWVEEGGNHWIRLRDSASAGQNIKLEPDWWKIHVSVRVKCTDVVLGTEGWYDARVAMMFADDTGERVGDWPNVLHWTGTFDWKDEGRDFTIPRGAKTLNLSCSIFSTTGVVEYDNLSVRLVALYPKPEDAAPPAPEDVLWSADRAWRQESPTRGRLCLNGSWRFHPGGDESAPPAAGTGWGWMRVPGSWAPGSGITPVGPDIWQVARSVSVADSVVAWYQRRADIPATWAGRRVFLAADNVVRFATVYVNGQEMGRIEWPEGRVDLTSAVTPGQSALISVLADARPVAPADWDAKTDQEKREAARGVGVRGLSGDVFLEAEPDGPRITDVLTMPSVRRRALGLRVTLADLPPGKYRLQAEARRDGKVARSWDGEAFDATAPAEGERTVSFPWADPVLWDVDRPETYDLVVRLRSADGKLLDEYTPVHFGFRELWIDGRDVYLNGRRFHIRAFDLQNPSSNGGMASEQACEWALRRFRDLGMNFVYLSTYDLDWGQIRYLDGVMEAADRLGFTISVCMPHAKEIVNSYQDPAKRAYWERMARWVARRAANHPSVIMYAMDHNWLGHAGDQNPRFLDASFPDDDPSLGQGSLKSRAAGRWAEEYVGQLDPTRPVYHHQSGSFGRWITLNCYLNWVPIQERMDWLSTSYHQGRKPIFLVEFGMPHQASFQRHRGGPFIWTNNVHAEPLNVEYAAMLFGDDAYDLGEANLAQYEPLARLYERKGTSFHFSEAFATYWSQHIEKDFLDVKAEYTRFTWPAFRTWQIAAVAPWDWSDMGRPRAGLVELSHDVTDLQQPGFRPDFVQCSDWFHRPPGDPNDYTVLGRTLRDRNQDLLAYLGGKPEKFTSRDHIFAAGERARKQLIFVNDTPDAQVFAYRWTASVDGREVGGDSGQARVTAGEVTKVAIAVALPAVKADAKGKLSLVATVGKQRGPHLEDSLEFDVLAPAGAPVGGGEGLAILDPAGLTTAALRKAGVTPRALQAGDEVPAGTRGLIIGREALRADEQELWQDAPDQAGEQALPPAEDLQRPALAALPAAVADYVRNGGRVLVCEQTERVLSRNLGFRTAFPGVRRVFVRCPWHPVLKGLSDDLLSLWRGSSTLTVAQTLSGPLGDPQVDWLGFGDSRVWKWGNYGQVASAVIEKPHRGDFLALADCEFDLDYSPLLEYRHPGGGSVLFCQLDLSERTEDDPAVARLWGNLVEWLTARPAEPMPKARRAAYLGGPQGRALLESLGVGFDAAAGPGGLDADGLLVVGEGAREALASSRQALASAVQAGAIVFCLPQQPADLEGWLPVPVRLEQREVTHTLPGRADTWLLRGLGPSELHWRGAMDLWALADLPEGSVTTPRGVIGAVPHGRGWVVFCQASPAQFDDEAKPYLRLSRQRCAQMLSRLLANCGAGSDVPLLRNLTSPGALGINLAGDWLVRPDPDGVGDAEQWYAPDLDDGAWRKLRTPGFWEEAGVGMDGYDGVAWLRTHFTVDRPVPEKGLELVLGAVDDEDWTYLNGQALGHRGQDTDPEDYWSVERRYPVPAGLLRQGDNVLAVKVRDLRGGGGIGKGPVRLSEGERWLESFYVNAPVATDDPYRYTRW